MKEKRFWRNHTTKKPHRSSVFSSQPGTGAVSSPGHSHKSSSTCCSAGERTGALLLLHSKDATLHITPLTPRTPRTLHTPRCVCGDNACIPQGGQKRRFGDPCRSHCAMQADSTSGSPSAQAMAPTLVFNLEITAKRKRKADSVFHRNYFSRTSSLQKQLQ